MVWSNPTIPHPIGKSISFPTYFPLGGEVMKTNDEFLQETEYGWRPDCIGCYLRDIVWSRSSGSQWSAAYYKYRQSTESNDTGQVTSLACHRAASLADVLNHFNTLIFNQRWEQLTTEDRRWLWMYSDEWVDYALHFCDDWPSDDLKKLLVIVRELRKHQPRAPDPYRKQLRTSKGPGSAGPLNKS